MRNTDHMIDGKVSIIMPVYNGERYLSEAINSILNQTYVNWELWAIDDCSSDNSWNILERFRSLDARIHVIKMKTNKGAASARNLGLSASNGRYVAFLDSDDLWRKDKLEKELCYMQSKQAAIVFTAYDLVGEQGKDLGKIVPVPDKIDYKEHIYNNIISTITVLIDRQKTGPFLMPNLRAGQDLATWLMLLKRVPCAYGLNECLASYRQVPGSISHSIKRRIKRTWDVYRRSEGFSTIKSFYYLIMHFLCVLKKRKRKTSY